MEPLTITHSSNKQNWRLKHGELITEVPKGPLGGLTFQFLPKTKMPVCVPMSH